MSIEGACKLQEECGVKKSNEYLQKTKSSVRLNREFNGINLTEVVKSDQDSVFVVIHNDDIFTAPSKNLHFEMRRTVVKHRILINFEHVLCFCVSGVASIFDVNEK